MQNNSIFCQPLEGYSSAHACILDLFTETTIIMQTCIVYVASTPALTDNTDTHNRQWRTAKELNKIIKYIQRL